MSSPKFTFEEHLRSSPSAGENVTARVSVSVCDQLIDLFTRTDGVPDTEGDLDEPAQSAFINDAIEYALAERENEPFFPPSYDPVIATLRPPEPTAEQRILSAFQSRPRPSPLGPSPDVVPPSKHIHAWLSFYPYKDANGKLPERVDIQGLAPCPRDVPVGTLVVDTLNVGREGTGHLGVVTYNDHARLRAELVASSNDSFAEPTGAHIGVEWVNGTSATRGPRNLRLCNDLGPYSQTLPKPAPALVPNYDDRFECPRDVAIGTRVVDARRSNLGLGTVNRNLAIEPGYDNTGPHINVDFDDGTFANRYPADLKLLIASRPMTSRPMTSTATAELFRDEKYTGPVYDVDVDALKAARRKFPFGIVVTISQRAIATHAVDWHIAATTPGVSFKVMEVIGSAANGVQIRVNGDDYGEYGPDGVTVTRRGRGALEGCFHPDDLLVVPATTKESK